MDPKQEVTVSDIFERCKDAVTRSHKFVQVVLAMLAAYSAGYTIRTGYYWFYRKYYSIPNGPIGIPFFGCFFHMMRDPRFLVKMAQKYGAIFSVPLFTSSQIIFISDSSLVKQLFTQKAFLRRDQVSEHELSNKQFKSIWTVGDSNTLPLLLLNGEKWTTRRKHAQSTLFRAMTNQYVGNVLHQAIQAELEPYLDALIARNEAWYPRKLMQYLAFNTLFHTMFGHSVERNSTLYRDMIADFDNTFKLTARNSLAFQYAIFAKWKSFIQPVVFTRNRRNETIRKLIEKRIEERRLQSDSDSVSDHDAPKTYIDYTHQLVEQQRMTQDEEIADVSFLFLAGQDTTSSTLEMAVVLAAKHTAIQDRVRRELVAQMQHGFDLKLVHNCPLFRAFVHEILRISSVAYMGVQHTALRDHWIEYDGERYRIPKNSSVFMNTDYIHIYNQHDSNWSEIDGDKIVLNNWLSHDGRFVMNDSFVGFGVGRRDCVGRQLAMKEVQYVLAYLLMHYQVRLDENIANSIGDITDYRKGNFATAFLEPKIGVKLHRINV